MRVRFSASVQTGPRVNQSGSSVENTTTSSVQFKKQYIYISTVTQGLLDLF